MAKKANKTIQLERKHSFISTDNLNNSGIFSDHKLNTLKSKKDNYLSQNVKVPKMTALQKMHMRGLSDLIEEPIKPPKMKQ